MKKIYQLISIVFQPMLMPTYGILLLTNMEVFGGLPFVWRLITIIVTFVFTAFLPAIPILLMIKKGDVHDIFISKREERTIPYLFTFLAFVFWTLFLWRTMQFPTFMIAIGIGATLSILFLTFINLKWKISAHTSGIGGLVGGAFGVHYFTIHSYPTWLLTIFIGVSFLVAISRIKLDAHTPGQVSAGFVLGFLSVFIPCIFI